VQLTVRAWCMHVQAAPAYTPHAAVGEWLLQLDSMHALTVIMHEGVKKHQEVF
jgi:hypothetical protein